MLDSDDAVAIVGLATMVPGAEDVEGFWLNLLRGRETGGLPASLPPSSGVAASETSGLLSHVTYGAIENAGYDPAALNRNVLIVTVADTAGSDRSPALGSVVAGPAHGSGLAALRPASHALRTGGCDMAVVAGATAGQPDRGDAADHGGAACAVVVKRLRDALADHDHIWAVIRGIAGSDENVASPGDTAAAIADAALALAGARPDDISYVETCGVGSPRTDEVAALTRAYRGAGEASALVGRYRLGGIGSTAGPLGPISGLAGLVKAALALEREQLPPSTAEPLLDLDSPFQAQDRIAGWPRDPRRPRLAAVNALSTDAIGAHVVLAEAPARSYAMHAEEPTVLVWSGRSAAEERVVRAQVARYFVWRGEEVFADAAATLREGRATHPVRAAAVCTGALAAAAVLGAVDSPDVITAGEPASIAGPVTLRFPGHGSALAARGLYWGVPAFARAVDGWLDLLDGPELPVRNHWRGADAITAAASSAPSDARSPVAELDAALLFAVEAALGQLWLEAGVRPVVVVGDGIGLLAAATVTEVFAPADAAALVRAAVGTGGVDALERAVAGVPAKPPTVALRHAGAPRSVTAAEAGHPAFWAAAVRTPPVTDAWPSEASEGAGEEVSVGPDSLPTVGALLTTAARLWTRGYDIAWDRLAQPPLRQRVPMPGAGFEPAAAGAPLYPLAAAVRPVRRGATRLGIDVVTPADSGPLVLALPYAGASGRALNAVRRYLPIGCGLALVDLPGHGRRMGEECLRDVGAVVDELMAMVPTLPTPRLLLLGYSLGGSFSYELAARLVEAGTPPEGLIVCGSRSPQTGVGHPPIAHLPSGDPFLQEAVALGLAAREMLELPELAESFVGPLQADLVMVESFPYRPSRPRLPVPTCVVGMRGDWVVPEPSLRGWDDLCLDPPLQLRVDGGHLALHEREREFGETVHRAIEYLLERGQPVADPPIGRATSTTSTR